MVVAARNRLGSAFHARVIPTAAQPLVVVTNWGAHGAILLFPLVAAIAVAGALYRQLLARADSLTLIRLTCIVAAALAAGWCVPVVFSSDVYAYAAYGELARLGFSPYAHVPQGFHDALFADAAWQWGGAFPICVYGPAFVGLARSIVTALAPLGPLAQLDALRVAACAALFCCAPVAYVAFPGDRAAKCRAAATIAANPVAIWCAVEGHNDAIALAMVLTGFALASRNFPALGALVAALSALVKLPGALAAVSLGWLYPRARLGAAIGIALAGLFSIPLFAALVTNLAPHGRYTAQASLQAIVEPAAGPAGAFAAAAIVSALLLVGAVARLRSGSAEGWVRLGLAAWVLVPNPYPWYGLWLVALAALAPRTRAAVVAILLSFTSLLRYVPDAVAVPTPPYAMALGILAALPLLFLFGPWYNGRPA